MAVHMVTSPPRPEDPSPAGPSTLVRPLESWSRLLPGKGLLPPLTNCSCPLVGETSLRLGTRPHGPGKTTQGPPASPSSTSALLLLVVESP